MDITASTEVFTTPRDARRRAFVFQVGCWVVGIAFGLAAVGAVILATFAQLGVFQLSLALTRRPPSELACAANDLIICDRCDDHTRAWDYAPDYSRFCLPCLDNEADASADRGCWQYHNGRGA